MADIKKGDKVAWNTPQGETTGKVTGKITSEKSIKGHTIKASPKEPQFEVTSDTSGSKAAHKPDSLKKK
jgi:hypothetical protein